VNAIMKLSNFKAAPNTPNIDPATLYAFVYPNDQTRKVYLGALFWTAPAVGRDSQGGVLLHEMSHWFGTQDSFENYNGGASVYGINASHALARSHPELAIKHADSFEYFGESQ